MPKEEVGATGDAPILDPPKGPDLGPPDHSVEFNPEPDQGLPAEATGEAPNQDLPVEAGGEDGAEVDQGLPIEQPEEPDEVVEEDELPEHGSHDAAMMGLQTDADPGYKHPDHHRFEQ